MCSQNSTHFATSLYEQDNSKQILTSILKMSSSSMSSPKNTQSSKRAARPVELPRPQDYEARDSPQLKLVSSAEFIPPSDPIRTNFQQEMLLALVTKGHWGLSQTIYEYADEQLQTSRSKYWQVIKDDQMEERNFVLTQLYTLPTFVLESLIRNTITSDQHVEPRLKEFMHKNMKLTRMPGVYLNVLSRADEQSHAGKWLSANEVEGLIRSIESYLAADPTSNQSSRQLDEYLSPCPPLDSNHINSRRWLVGGNAVRKFEDWKKFLTRSFCEQVDASSKDIPHSRCPMEVGWFTDVQKCQSEHVNNSSTKYLFGFLNAWLRMTPTIQFPAPAQFTLFHIWDGEHLPELSVILGSILCSSDSTQGGLNSSGFSESSFPADFDLSVKLDWNARHVASLSHLEQTMIDDWKIQRTRYYVCQNLDPAIMIARNNRIKELEDNIVSIRENTKKLTKIREEKKKELQHLREKRNQMFIEGQDEASKDNRRFFKLIENLRNIEESRIRERDEALALFDQAKNSPSTSIVGPSDSHANPYFQDLMEKRKKFMDWGTLDGLDLDEELSEEDIKEFDSLRLEVEEEERQELLKETHPGWYLDDETQRMIIE